jgi:hypothetical protein
MTNCQEFIILNCLLLVAGCIIPGFLISSQPFA